MKHLLVVDDDPTITALLHTALTGAGYRVAVASDGIQGLEVVKRERPDVLITDLIMPADGVALCKAVKQDFSNIAIVALTGGDYPEDLAGHCDVFLRKPVDIQRLIDTLEQLEFSKMLNSIDPSAQTLRW